MIPDENENENGQNTENTGNDEPQDAETRSSAAEAGGYNLGQAPVPEEKPSLTQPDMAAVEDGDRDDDRISTQAGREAAGPFTGTGNQDALRSAGLTGANQGHHADQRTSGDESAVPEEGQEAENRRFGNLSGEGEPTEGEEPEEA